MWKAVTFAVVLAAVFITIQAQDSCVVCTSTTDHHPQCIGEDSAQFSRPCGVARNQTCFSRVNEGGRVDRGCLNDLPAAVVAECEGSETCELCSGLNCNSNAFPPQRIQCHICAGGVNSTCSGVVNSTMTFCPIFTTDDRCYTARPNGNYERGCMSSLSSTSRCTGDEPCLICIGNGCNAGEYSSAMNVFSGVKMIPFLLLSLVIAVLNK